MSAILAFLGVRGTIAASLALALALVAGVQTARLWSLQAESADALAKLELARGANKGWQAIADAAERERAAADAARRRQAEQAAEAIADAKKVAANAEQRLADFQERWGNRPKTCAVALTQMEAACAGSLSDY